MSGTTLNELYTSHVADLTVAEQDRVANYTLASLLAIIDLHGSAELQDKALAAIERGKRHACLRAVQS